MLEWVVRVPAVMVERPREGPSRGNIVLSSRFIDAEYAYVQIIDTANMNVLAGPEGLKPGDELTVRVTLVPPRPPST